MSTNMISESDTPAGHPVPWIAERLCGPGVLFLIHRGDLTAAATEVSHQRGIYRRGPDRIQVHDTTISYQFDGQTGTVPVTEIVSYARQLHDPERGRWLHASYSRFLRATSAWTPDGEPVDPDHAAAELRAASAAWWTPNQPAEAEPAAC